MDTHIITMGSGPGGIRRRRSSVEYSTESVRPSVGLFICSPPGPSEAGPGLSERGLQAQASERAWLASWSLGPASERPGPASERPGPVSEGPQGGGRDGRTSVRTDGHTDSGQQGVE